MWILFFSSFLLLLNAVSSYPARARNYYLQNRPHSSLCPDEPKKEIDCEEGVQEGVCGGRGVCLKGPGDICGGLGDQYGVCGAGLVCSSCNRCIGCSYKSFKCFDDFDCLSEDNVWLSIAFWHGLETLIMIV